MTAPPIEPTPPVAPGVAMPWDAEVADPVAAIAQARRDHGDTFVVESGGDRYLFTFSPVGVRSFYALEESHASKGVADWRMLRRKIPDEVFQGRRTFPHELFTRDDAASHLLGLEKALDATLGDLGDEGEVDVFALTRRLGRARTEQCVLESARLAQRSIMSRFVLQPVVLDDGHATYSVSPGVTIATLLPLTNTSAAPGLEGWDPDHWNRRRLADSGSLPTVELVTVFGHGKHTCPAQPFSLAAMTTALVRLFATYRLTAGWLEHPTPASSQIGGVARAGGRCPVRYSRH